jgi:hypothetical protein
VGVHAAHTKHAASINLNINGHTTTRATWFRSDDVRDGGLDVLRRAA